MPKRTLLLARVLALTCCLALLAAVTIAVAPDTGHPPERIVTARHVDVVLNPTAIPAELVPAPTTSSTTTTEPPPPTSRPAETMRATSAPPVPSSSAEEALAAWFGDIYDQAYGVAMCESTMNPNAVSPDGANLGLLQINRVHADDFEAVTGVPFAEGWWNPWLNAQYARKLYDGHGGWGPWSCAWAAR